MLIEIAPHEARYLLLKCRWDRTVYLRRFNDGVSHDDIVRRDLAAQQIANLDSLIERLTSAVVAQQEN